MNKTFVVALSSAVAVGGLGWGLWAPGTGRLSGRVAHGDGLLSTAGSAGLRQETTSQVKSRPTPYSSPSELVASEPSIPLQSPTTSTAAAGALSSSGANSSAETIVWELEPGVRVPAAFVEPEAPLAAGPAAANERIAQEFERTIDSAESQAQDGAASVSEEAWSKALERADLQYRALNGDAAYGQQTMKSALDTGTTKGSKAP